MRTMMRKAITGLMICAIMMCAACNAETFKPLTVTVVSEDQFGGIQLSINKLDLEYGDSINLSFSGGYEERSVPYYPDFFGDKGQTVVNDYFDYILVTKINESFTKNTGVTAGETVTITLDERGKYKEILEAYNVDVNKTRREDQTEEAFINAREVTGGNIAPGVLYRGSSPTDKSFGRTDLMAAYIADNGINCILDLSDTEEKIAEYDQIPDLIRTMYDNGQLLALGIGIDLSDARNREILGQGLIRMFSMDGPYLIHCSYGRDRTGFLCAYLEALCGAPYEAIIDDFMFSYDALHAIDMNPESLQYKLFKQRIDDEMSGTLGIAIEDLPTADLESATRRFFGECGMSEEQIDHMKEILTQQRG